MTSPLSKRIAANRDRSYYVGVAPGLSSGDVCQLVDAVDKRKSLLVTTPTVAELYASRITLRLRESGVDVRMVVLESSEQSKNIAEVEKLCKECFRAGLDRKSLLIGCGGGVCTDLVTMAASLTRRGLSYVRIPTTLIGLIDAGIGVKGAVNLPHKKSAIGCFHPPDQVLLDPAFLRSLPRELVADGLAEAIKVAVATDPALFGLLENNSAELLDAPLTASIDMITDLVWRSSVRLLEELEPNLYEEQSYERLLDFGHTFSPMVESESHFQISHGTAVAIDIALSSAIAFELGLLSSTDGQRIHNLLRNSGLPTYSELLTLESCMRAMVEIEAHRGGHLNLVVPNGIGSAVFIVEREQLAPAVLNKALDSVRRGSRETTKSRIKPIIMDTPAFGWT